MFVKLRKRSFFFFLMGTSCVFAVIELGVGNTKNSCDLWLIEVVFHWGHKQQQQQNQHIKQMVTRAPLKKMNKA